MFLRIKEKIFYGWVIVATSLVIVTALIGIRFSFGVFFKSLESEFGLTRAATSAVYSTYMVLAAVFGMVSGWALDRYGPRPVVFLMGLLTGLSLLFTSQASSSWQLFISYSLILSMGTGGIYPVLMTPVLRWFDKRRGLALGIANSGAGLGTIIMAPLAAYLISNLGWRMSYIVMGLVAWLVVISLSRLLRNDPSEIGALPDGVKSGEDRTESKGTKESIQLPGFSVSQAFKTRSFWLIAAVWLFFASCLHLILAHVVAYATDTGISTMEAATILAIAGGTSILSRGVSGRVSDIIGRKVPGITCALLQAGALLWLIRSHDLWMFYLFAVVYGLSWGGLAVPVTTLVSDIFGVRKLGLIMGTLDVPYAIGAAIGPAIGGVIFDVTNSYAAAFLIAAAVMLIVPLLIAFTRREANITEIA